MRQLYILIQKEFIQIFRNPLLPKLIIIFPIMVMLVLPWVTTMDVRNVGVTIIDEDCSIDPMDVMKKLDEANVESRPIWKPMHMQPVFKDNDFISVEEKSVGEQIFGRGLCLPSDIKMTEEEQDIIIDIIKSMF